VLVVGAGGAIGAAVCAVLATDGHAVWAADLARPDEVVAGLPGSDHRAVAFDVCDHDAVDRVVLELGEAGPVAGAVYAAGLIYTGPVSATAWDEYDRLMAVNLRGAFKLGQSLSSLATRQAPGSFVLLSSVAGLKGEAGGSVYCASKFGLIGFAQSLAAELAPHGWRCNVVCPGNVDTPMLRTLAEAMSEPGEDSGAALRTLAAASAFDRLITTDEVAEACAFLLSARSSGISGQTLVVDGPPPA
jgi:NAD(P)-dependent dehydrogenase (short-subunit alcohol dehydrogenase family)